MNSAKLDSREWVYREALKSLVGPAAELRSERGGGSGWRRFVSKEEKSAVHEAAHAVCGHALLGYRVSELTLDPSAAIKVRRGVLKACCIFDARINLWNRIMRWFRRADEPEPLEHDQRRALRFCILLCPEPVSWASARRYYRVLERHAAKFVDENWVSISVLSTELQKHRRLDADQVGKLLTKPALAAKPWIPPITCESPSLRRIQ
jgi:hypothetical protein